jgi:hypothetical protein
LKELNNFVSDAPEFFNSLWKDFHSKFLVPAFDGIDESVTAKPCISEIADVIHNVKQDLSRLKLFHLPDTNPDRFKFAGYIGYWIAKIKPIELGISGPDRPPILAFVNEYFALWAIRALIKYDLPDEYINRIVYTLHFRQIDPDSLTLLVQAMEEISQLRMIQNFKSENL